MCDDKEQTKPASAEFDFSAFPENTLFHERRTGRDRRKTDGPDPHLAGEPAPSAPDQRRPKKERRRRIDPTTFEKQYTPDEMEFMNAMQRFKEGSGRSFPTYGEVLKIAIGLGYRLVVVAPEPTWDEVIAEEECLAESAIINGPHEPTTDPIRTPTGAC